MQQITQLQNIKTKLIIFIPSFLFHWVHLLWRAAASPLWRHLPSPQCDTHLDVYVTGVSSCSARLRPRSFSRGGSAAVCFNLKPLAAAEPFGSFLQQRAEPSQTLLSFRLTLRGFIITCARVSKAHRSLGIPSTDWPGLWADITPSRGVIRGRRRRRWWRRSRRPLCDLELLVSVYRRLPLLSPS